jgi:hypothetical protein
MALIEIRTDLSRVVIALERIADLLDEIAHPALPLVEQSGEEDLGSYVTEVEDGRTVWDQYSPRRNY